MDKIYKLLERYSMYRGQNMIIILTRNKGGWVESEYGEKDITFESEKELFSKIDKEMYE